MTLWRIRHLPTNQYYSPNRWVVHRNQRVQTNLHPRGKLYTRRPSLSWLSCGYYSHWVDDARWQPGQTKYWCDFQAQDWVIEPYGIVQ